MSAPSDHAATEPGTAPESAANPVAVDAAAANTENKVRKEPPPEKPADVKRRTWVILSFWFIVLCFGLPVWWYTTSIVRASLPLDEMMNWADGKACQPIFPITVALDAPALADPDAQQLLHQSQNALDALNDFAGHQLRLELSKPTHGDQNAKSVKTDPSAALTIHLTPGEKTVATLQPQSPTLAVTYSPDALSSTESSNSALANFIASQVRSTFAEEQALLSYLLATSPSLQPEQRFQSGSYPEFADVLSKRMTRSFKYSRTYHLTFSLFTDGPMPSSWDVEAALDEYMRPVLNMLGPIHNFTIDTQVQLYAAPGVQSQNLTKADLSSFINAAEWPLSPSIGGAPTINFVLYAGDQTVVGDDESETSQSWLIPQWGSVYLLARPSEPHVSSELLKAPLLTFTSHLLSLLGTPQSESLPLRLSTLARVRSADVMLKASSSLGSLARLSSNLPSISIPPSVADGVTKSLGHLEVACATLGTLESLEHARIAEAEAERAFFEKSMVGQLYFPDEHKIAVYLPLLGPVGVPLVMGLLNEIKQWKARRSVKAKTA